MSVGEEVRAKLVADATVATLVGGRIYAMRLPQNVALPAVVFGEVSNVPQSTLAGRSEDITVTRLQLDVYAKSYVDAAAAAAAIESVMLRLRAVAPGLTAWREASRDLFDDELVAHRRSMDFSVWR